MDMDKMMQRMRGMFIFQRHEQDLDQCPAARGCPRSLSSCLVLCQFIMGPTDQLVHAIMNGDTEALNEATGTYTKMMATFGNCPQG